MLLLLVLLSCVPDSHAQIGDSIGNPIDTFTVFVDDVASNTSGYLQQWDQGTIFHMITTGEGLTLFLAYDMIDQTVDTTLIYAMAIRDATKMPTATLGDLHGAYLNGTTLAAVTVGVIGASDPVRMSGNASTSHRLYVTGSTDSYGNVIDWQDSIFMDFAVYFTTPNDAQNATVYVQTRGDLWSQVRRRDGRLSM